MDDKTAIETLHELHARIRAINSGISANSPQKFNAGELDAVREVIAHSIQAIEALGRVRKNIDAATTPAEMVEALYAVTDGAEQNRKVANMRAQLEPVDLETDDANVADMRREHSEAFYGKPSPTYDPEKVRALLVAIETMSQNGWWGQSFAQESVADLATAVRESESK